jgi:hypothetical protein
MADSPSTALPPDADPPPDSPALRGAGERADVACRRPGGPHERRHEALRAAYDAGLAAVGAIVVTAADLEELHPDGCPGCAVCGLLLPILRAGRAAVLEAARAARR